MKTVGDQFASGEMQLPFVLKSAETMKKAVAHLEPKMEKADTGGRGRIVLATVSGDVHDIGKNLVDIILSNNGYEVHNLGIKVGIGEMIKVFEETKADAIGMSGLLVKSTLIMRDNLEELERRGLGKVPVLLGGAALTRNYVEADLRSRYAGPLYYGKNAFAGLDAMQRIVSGEPAPAPEARASAARRRATRSSPFPARSPHVETDNQIFKPPFVGSRVVRGVSSRRDHALHQPDRPVPQPVAVSTRVGRERPRVQGATPTSCSAISWPGPALPTCSGRNWSTGTLRPTPTETTW